MVSRAERSAFSEWWWTVDKVLLGCLIVLLCTGLVLSFGASPPVATRLGYSDSFYFVKRHVVFMLLAIPLLIGTSFLTPRRARRLSIIMFVGMICLMVLTLVIGVENNGSRRWVDVAGFSLQPSEFMKPAFVVVCAWLFTEKTRNDDIPGNLFAILLLGIVVALLIAQPDFGQTILSTVAWATVFFVAGMPWLWIALIGGAGSLGVITAYLTIPHVAGRIDSFLDPGAGDTFQIDRSLDAFINGGFFGVGPGEGTVKNVLPDAHTDFIFAVAGEEFGALFCMALVGLYAFIVIRGLIRASKCENPFNRVAGTGLIVAFGVQAAINIAVSVQLIPSKGMTLPFISSGGSSMMAVAVTMGLFLAVTRRRPQEKRSRRGETVAGGLTNPA
ncbi:MAG: putative lipid II flippase FtsW [Bauldia sp.]|nr:putative lipid II flippase FtsW [Bauldia sp.]